MDDRESGYHTDARPTDELICAALANYEKLDEYVPLVESLQYRGTEEVFETALRLTKSEDTHKRVLGASVLAGVGANRDRFIEGSIEALIPLLRDDDEDVVEVAAYAVGRRGMASGKEASSAARALPSVMSLVDHPAADIRAGTAYALASIQWLQLSPDEYHNLIGALIRLASDDDEDVRLEAVDGLRFARMESDLIMNTLIQRIHDESPEVRASALLGLAFRKHPHIVDMLIEELRSSDVVCDDTLDAAIETEDCRLRPVLIELQEEGVESPLIEQALKHCSSGQE